MMRFLTFKMVGSGPQAPFLSTQLLSSMVFSLPIHIVYLFLLWSYREWDYNILWEWSGSWEVILQARALVFTLNSCSTFLQIFGIQQTMTVYQPDEPFLSDSPHLLHSQTYSFLILSQTTSNNDEFPIIKNLFYFQSYL